MGVLSDTTLTQEEVDLLTEAVLSERIVDEGKVTPLDRVDCPSWNYFNSKARDLGTPVNGGWRFQVKGNTDRVLQWWTGADILTFESKVQLTSFMYESGKAHMGNEIIYERLERAGIRVQYGKGMPTEGGAARARGMHVAADIIREDMDDFDYNWTTAMREAMWLPNSADAKAFAGFDALFPATGNTTGDIGGKNRSNPLFRHKLVTGVTKATFQKTWYEFVRDIQEFANGKRLDAIFAGDNFYGMLVDLFSGSDTAAGKWDYRAAHDLAMRKGEKMKIALPQDCFMYEDVMFAREPVFRTLQAKNPATNPSWLDRCYGFVEDVAGFHSVLDDLTIRHDMPYNQRLERVSKHGEAVCWANNPRGVGVMVK